MDTQRRVVDLGVRNATLGKYLEERERGEEKITCDRAQEETWLCGADV